MKLLVTFTLLLLLFVAPAAATYIESSTAQQEQKRPEPNPPAMAAGGRSAAAQQALSPHLIEWLIDVNEELDLKQIWRMLNMDIPTDMAYVCGGDCAAETFDVDVSGEGAGKTVAVKIAVDNGEFYQYLFFKKQEPGEVSEWKFIGNVNSSYQKYGPPSYRVESGDGRTWFIIKELWDRGSGMVKYGEAWYEIKETGVKQVLRYPVEGYSAPCLKRLGRSFKSLLTRHDLDDGVYTITVQFLISYNISDCYSAGDPPPLFSKWQKGCFVWDPARERFVLDEKRSEVTEKELRYAYDSDSLSAEKLIRYNFSELLTVARSANPQHKEWLRGYISSAAPSPQKLALQRALQQ